MRGGEKELAQIALKKENILSCGFKLFAEKTIDAVTMNDVAQSAGLGIATLYRYYKTKTDLVLAVSERTLEKHIKEEWIKRFREEMTGAERIEQYLEALIDIYRKTPEMLRFNQFFNVYVSHEAIEKEKLLPYMQIIDEIRSHFHETYQLGCSDGTLKQNIGEEQMFSTLLHVMLAAVTRYAVGLVYTSGGSDPLIELECLKHMMLSEFTATLSAEEQSNT